MAVAIRFDNLKKTYRERGNGKEALKGISFEVPQGEIFGFLGPNGAGKTTAMHILLDFIFASDGRAEILGIDSRDPGARDKVGFLPEVFNFDGFLRGEDFLRLFGRLGGASPEAVKARTPELLEFLDMPTAGGVRIRNYSKGMTQKIGLAQALIADPQVLILDEPTSGMDPIAKAKVKQLLQKLRSEGKTVFLSTHILSDIEDIADRVAIINNGELLAVDKLGALLSSSEPAYRVSYRGGDEHLRNTMSLRLVPAVEADVETVTCVTRDDKDFALATILKHNGDVVSVKQVGTSLLNKFLELVKHEELSNDK
ncbi:MAG: ABC transporter ATP-binding protein [Candidatus Zixiibacteriota bacterium]